MTRIRSKRLPIPLPWATNSTKYKTVVATWLLAVGLPAAGYAAPNCNANNLNAPDACTEADVDQEISSFKRLSSDLLGRASASSDIAYIRETGGNLDGYLNGLPRDRSYYSSAIDRIEQATFSLNAMRDRLPATRGEASRASDSHDSNVPSAAVSSHQAPSMPEPKKLGTTALSEGSPEVADGQVSSSDVVKTNSSPSRDYRGLFNLFLFVVVIIAFIVGGLYLMGTSKCPSCRKRIRLRRGDREILDRTTRYREVSREVKDRDGRVLRRYKETVPYRSEQVRYDLTCPQCSHQWQANRVENFD